MEPEDIMLQDIDEWMEMVMTPETEVILFLDANEEWGRNKKS